MTNTATLDAKGLNVALSANILSDETMRTLGFTDHRESTWYFCSRVGNGITFNLSIPKNGDRLDIDVLDEDFMQPYDYQRILKQNPNFEFAVNIKTVVEGIMTAFSEAGVINGYTKGMYI